MVHYNKESENPIFVDFRESAPYSVDEDLYNSGNFNKANGVGSVAVPSFVPGVHHIWKRHGKINWTEIVEPTRKLLDEGFPFSSSTAETLPFASLLLNDYPVLRESLINAQTDRFYEAGENYTDKILGKTFRVIRDHPEEFVSGDLGKDFFEDLCRNEDKKKCFLRDSDRFTYHVKESKPAEREVFGKILYTAALPSSAVICGFLMKVIEASFISSFNRTDPVNYSHFLHRYIEAMKFGYALRTHFGDPTEIPDSELLKQSYEYISENRFARLVADYLIKDKGVNPDTDFYNVVNSKNAQPRDSGTSHVSVLDSDGNGVAMTTTINGAFGSFIKSPSTGIIYNNEMDDFSAKGDVNIFGFTESANNFVKGGRRPLSSMSPSVIVDPRSKKAVLVSGASGGSRIISATTLTMLNYLIGNMDIVDAMNQPRVHHQYTPNEVRVEDSRPLQSEVKDLLESYGHIFSSSNSFASVQSAVNEDGIITASADSRKNGKPYGV